MRTAAPSRRLKAAALDALFVYLLRGAMLYGLLLSGAGATNAQLFVAADFFVVLAYGAVELLTGATLAKRLLGLQIRRPSGQAAGRGALIGRWLLKFLPIAAGLAANVGLVLVAMRAPAQPTALMVTSTLSGFLICWGLVDFSFSFGASRAALHDRLAGTVVADLRA